MDPNLNLWIASPIHGEACACGIVLLLMNIVVMGGIASMFVFIFYVLLVGGMVGIDRCPRAAAQKSYRLP